MQFQLISAQALNQEWQAYICQTNLETFGWTIAMTQSDFGLSQAYYLLVEQDSEPCAYLSYHVMFDEVEIIQIFVDPHYRQQGIGQRMMMQLQQTYAHIFLEVRAGNQAAIRLYEVCEFKTVAIRQNYYRQPIEDALMMAWTQKGGKGE